MAPVRQASGWNVVPLAPLHSALRATRRRHCSSVIRVAGSRRSPNRQARASTHSRCRRSNHQALHAHIAYKSRFRGPGSLVLLGSTHDTWLQALWSMLTAIRQYSVKLAKHNASPHRAALFTEGGVSDRDGVRHDFSERVLRGALRGQSSQRRSVSQISFRHCGLDRCRHRHRWAGERPVRHSLLSVFALACETQRASS